MRTNKTATITRLEEIAPGSSIKDWKAAGEIIGFFLPLSDEKRQIAAELGIIGKAFVFYTTGTDIFETDRLVIDTGNGTDSFDVKGIKKYDVDSTLDHLEILLEERKK